jgi:hypothetical protein
MHKLKILWQVGLGLCLFVGLSVLVFLTTHQRPLRTNEERVLFQGVRYTRQARAVPRPLMIHLVTVDLTAPGIRLLATPGEATGGMELPARTTSEFISAFGLQLAINGSFFEPFHAGAFWDYYPHSGDPVNIKGLGISNGVRYSASEDRHAVLCVLSGPRVEIQSLECPAATEQAVPGDVVLVEQGRAAALPGEAYYTQLHPRTAVAIDEGGETLWLMLVDGRQRGYSEGMTNAEMAGLALELGAFQALNLDGGGSTTLVVAEGGRARTLNAPIHTGVPMRQRPVANHLGIYALPDE